MTSLCCGTLGNAEQVTVSGIGDSHDANVEELSRSSA